MPRLTPDQSFYPSRAWRWRRAPEKLAYVAMLNSRPREVATRWPSWTSIPRPGLRRARRAGRHARRRRRAAPLRVERVQLVPVPVLAAPAHASGAISIVPGMRSSRIHILDTQPDPRSPAAREGHRGARKSCARPATAARTPSHCGPDGIYSTRSATRRQRPRRHLRARPRDVRDQGRWERDRGPQHLAYDFWWHLGHDTMITSEWGTPNMVEDGRQPRAAAGRQVRPRAARVGSAARAVTCRRWISAPSSRWCSSCGPRTIPTETYGFVGVVTWLKDLSASVWMWHREGSNGSGSGRSGR